MNGAKMSLSEFRKRKGYTMAQLANLVKVSKRAIESYEYGKRKPSPEVGERIANVLGMDTQTMLCSTSRRTDLVSEDHFTHLMI